MANNEFKTTVITYDERESAQKTPEPEVKDANKPNIQNVLFNITTKVPHVAETLPTVEVQTQEENSTKKVDLRSIEEVNKNASSLPKFYVREYKRSARLVVIWAIITALCAGV